MFCQVLQSQSRIILMESEPQSNAAPAPKAPAPKAPAPKAPAPNLIQYRIPIEIKRNQD
jgi:hypothetical protein